MEMLIHHEICLISLHSFQTYNYTQITDEWVQSVTSEKIAYPSKELEDFLVYMDGNLGKNVMNGF